mmetsp:Transcript_21880/g.32722  ORF Transcript_21880/g.32722 Transcript_21880/m.32722 type:complete len:87 (+) Transcript_21880:395-655(+)
MHGGRLAHQGWTADLANAVSEERGASLEAKAHQAKLVHMGSVAAEALLAFLEELQQPKTASGTSGAPGVSARRAAVAEISAVSGAS